MYGHHTLTAPIEEILEHYSIRGDEIAVPPRYSIAPRIDIPICRLVDDLC
jgi:hypothetical protein